MAYAQDVCSTSGQFDKLAKLAEVPAPSELSTVAERVHMHVKSLRDTHARIDALHSRLAGRSVDVEGLVDTPARCGIVGQIQDALDEAHGVNVKIDCILSALERIG